MNYKSSHIQSVSLDRTSNKTSNVIYSKTYTPETVLRIHVLLTINNTNNKISERFWVLLNKKL